MLSRATVWLAVAAAHGQVVDCGRMRTMIAVNAGGPSFVASNDAVYEADRYHTGGEASDFGFQFPISGTEDPELYQTERYAITGQELVYALPMPVDVKGLFVLTLKFSEVYFERPGQKVFSVMLNDHTIIKDLDVFKKVGKNAAYDRQVEFRVSNSSSEIIFESAKGSSKPAVSVPYDGTLTVRFVSSGKDNPKVNALLVTQGSLADLQLQQIPQRREREEEQEDESSGELGLAVTGVLICFLAPWAYAQWGSLSKAKKKRR